MLLRRLSFRPPAPVPLNLRLARTAATQQAHRYHFPNVASQILPRLYLSGVHVAMNEMQLTELGITHIVSIIEQKPRYPKELPLKKLHIPLADLPDSNILQHLDETTAFIRTALEDPRSVVLVHCAMGISRSATVVCAYLVAAHNMSADAALAFVVAKRECVCPNLGFRRQLAAYAARARKSGPRKLCKAIALGAIFTSLSMRGAGESLMPVQVRIPVARSASGG